MSDLPTIVSAAILWKGFIISMPAPARHHDLIRCVGERTFAEAQQGFLSSEGKFVNRIAAQEIVRANGQRVMLSTFTHDHELFSEEIF